MLAGFCISCLFLLHLCLFPPAWCNKKARDTQRRKVCILQSESRQKESYSQDSLLADPTFTDLPTSNFGPVNCGYYLDGKEKTLVIHLGTSSVVVLVGILPESIDRGYFAVVQKFSQETARGAAVDCWTRLSLSLSLSLPNCVINSIWEQDTNERARCIIWPHPPRWWQQQLAI